MTVGHWQLRPINGYIASMTMWAPELSQRTGPVYRAIADAIDEDVQKGALQAGARLPPHRELADRLGVTVTTITRAYAEAARRGLIAGHVGRGTFIRGTNETGDDQDQGPLDLSINVLMPDKEVATLERSLFARRVLPWTQLLGYVPTRGHLRHREAMAEWLAESGLTAHPDSIVLSAGAQHGMAVSFSATLKPGETLLVEDLTYSGAKLLAKQMGIRLRGVAIDVEGLRPDALESAIRTTRARVLYCMPRLQNPTSAVMSERRRQQIAAVAARHRLIVIEDDTYGFLSPEREPLASLLPDQTIYTTSLSKSLFPGLRIGCVVPPAALAESVAAAVWATIIMTSPIGADIMSAWIEDGTAARIAEWKRHEVAARQQMIRRLLEGERFQTHASSPHAWLHLPPRWESDAFVAHARTRGVVVNASREFTTGEREPRGVRLCLGTPRTRAGLEQALTRVLDALRDRAPAARVVV
jgi:DNA-binding transcriptional MocR family regulator